MQNVTDPSEPAITLKHWVALYADSAYSWALYKTSSKEVAEDLVQETFLAALQSFNTFKGNSNPKTWLFSILNNKIKDHYRNRFLKPTLTDNGLFEKLFDEDEHWKNGEMPREWPEHTTHLLDDPEFQKVLTNCLKKLPDNWFAAIQLKFIENKKSKLICQDLGITATNFWQIVHRAKMQLRKCLDLNWFK
jgi:RNA polymerase sigma-70 factor (TIGR02943 family)